MMLLMLLEQSNAVFHGHVSSRGRRPANREEVILQREQPLPTAALVAQQLPAEFDWRSVDGVNYVTSDVNQHVPTYCGSCWIHGTVSALNDRIKVQRKAAFPDVMLSRQAIMNCVPAAAEDGKQPGPPPGCGGGDPWMIHNYMLDTPVPDETCQPYEAKNGVCEPLGTCRNCFPGDMAGSPIKGGCFAMPAQSYPRFGVEEHGKVVGEGPMMAEIHARGPIVCSIVSDMRFIFNYSSAAAANEGVYMDPKKHAADEVDHDVEVTGWGVTPGGVKYWVVRNSWGTYWGEAGWFKVARGTGQEGGELQLESDCYWANPTVHGLDEVLQGEALGDYVTGVHAVVLTAKGAAATTAATAKATTAATAKATTAATAKASTVNAATANNAARVTTAFVAREAAAPAAQSAAWFSGSQVALLCVPALVGLIVAATWRIAATPRRGESPLQPSGDKKGAYRPPVGLDAPLESSS